jgi:23S rRNA pseudouridine1911/1915/1917 synthase
MGGTRAQKKMKENDAKASTNLEMDVKSEDAGRRLDLYISEQVESVSRSRVQKLLDVGMVRINQAVCRDKNYRLQPGDRVSLTIPPPEEATVRAEEIALAIVYEDSDLLVLNKPRGMVVHPSPGHAQGTLVNALLSHCSDLSGIGGVMRPGIVHRLDKDTSGLLIVAKNDLAHRSLATQLKSRKLSRVYIALVCGKVTPRLGRIEAPVGRHPRHRKKMAVITGGREAVTRYRVIKYFKRYSLLQLSLETGRTHQIRVHLAHLGYPIVGDLTYARGGWSDLPPELTAPQALHAHRISFTHPRSGEIMHFSAPLPETFKKTLHWLKAKE